MKEVYEEIVKMRADYQFGAGAGDALASHGLKIGISKRTGKPRYVYSNDGKLLATIRWNDGMIALTVEGARLLLKHFKPPRLRVVIVDEAVNHVKKGRSVFAKHVIDVDPKLRSGDEVIVVDRNDNLLAVGRALLSGLEMLAFNVGVAVKVRRGVSDEGSKPKGTT
ncbi:MAG: PUA domain-containing protein [Nitrososphaerota archaeon]|nr:pseudouridine synthase [Candidatus Nezhaarchaeota archaeon]MDW8050222.1 PUA domain-containing protein [Nitrososphaerota archaeon]